MVRAAEPVERVFRALADPTRRKVLERLGRGSASMTELAGPFRMALPSFVQHMRVLEESGLVSSKKVGRVRTYHLAPQRLKAAEQWLSGRISDEAAVADMAAKFQNLVSAWEEVASVETSRTAAR